MEYEAELNRGISDHPMLVLCTYPLTTCGATEFLDVAGTHQFALAKRGGRWEMVETPQLRQAKAETCGASSSTSRARTRSTGTGFVVMRIASRMLASTPSRFALVND
jgi:hypothetical protein